MNRASWACFAAACCLGVPLAAWAQPAVTAVAGTPGHGDSIVVSGSGFGAKDPAPPLWWDDGEGAAVDTMIPRFGEGACAANDWIVSGTLSGADKCYNDAQPRAVTEDGGVSNIHYRGINHRNTEAPHPRSTRFLTGCHDDEGECLGGEVGQNVGLTIGDTSRHEVWWFTYYLRHDPLWPVAPDGVNQNYKFLNVESRDPTERPTAYSNTSGFVYTTSRGCGASCGIGPSCDEAYWSGMGAIQTINPATCPVQASPNCWDPIGTQNHVNNPMRQWTREEWAIDYAAQKKWFLVDNVYLLDTRLDADCDFDTSRLPEAPSGVTIGGFWKEAMCGNDQDDLNDDACRYFDDVYVDNTFARVLLADAADYTAATILEPQIPSAWADGEVTVTVNLGKLASCTTAYLFVFDASDARNVTGFPVELPCGSPECSDDIDNDGDGQIDHPGDTGCDSPDDDDESDCGDGACEPGEACPEDCGAGGGGGTGASSAGGAGVGGAPAGTPAEGDSGCGCRATGSPSSLPGWLWLAVLPLVRRRRR